MSRITLHDVAAAAGVSAKTVSNVVNGTGRVGEETRARVQQAIAQLGYRPNLAARGLRQGRSGILALAVPDLREPYFAELAAEFVDQAQESNFSVAITQTRGQLATELSVINGEGLPTVDSIILSPLTLTREHLDRRSSRVPLIFLGEHGSGIANGDISHVGIDNVAASRDATKQLLENGRTRIATIGVQAGSRATSSQRHDGYLQALADHGIQPQPELFGDVEVFNRAQGYAAAQELLSRTDFDAILAFNDTLAFGAISALVSNNVKIPDEVEIIAFDNTDESSYVRPPMSSVDPNRAEIARATLDIASTGEAPPNHVVVPHRIIKRA